MLQNQEVCSVFFVSQYIKAVKVVKNTTTDSQPSAATTSSETVKKCIHVKQTRGHLSQILSIVSFEESSNETVTFGSQCEKKLSWGFSGHTQTSLLSYRD